MFVTSNDKTPVDLLLRPRDPIILRDARPFSTDPGARAFTLDWPMPSTIAGALRTHIGAAAGTDWTSGAARRQALGIEFRGAFLVDRDKDSAPWTPYLRAPADAVVYRPADKGGDGGAGDPKKHLNVMRLRPDESLQEGDGCNLPYEQTQKERAGDTPAETFDLLPMKVERDEKPVTKYTFWSLADTITWLTGGDVSFQIREGIERESRVHVAVSGETYTAEEGRLFATTGLAFSPASRSRWEKHPESAILCRVHLNGQSWTPDAAFLTLGGERRQVRVAESGSLERDPWTIPDELIQALKDKTRLRLQLVTPALFRTGWCPGWLTQKHRDRNPPQINGLGLKLRAAAVGRRVPISGWDLTNGCEKPIRYAAPAGSVYFFDVAKPLSREQIEALWLAPLSDGVYNRQDGFGLAVPGVWPTSDVRG